MESEKVPCKTEGCNAKILEITAKKTGGYCYPCYRKIEAREREEYIRKNRKDVNLYEGIIEPIEIIKIMHSDKKYNPLIRYIPYEKTLEEMYNLISDENIEELKEYSMELYDSGNDTWENILLNLLCLRDANIDECLKVLVRDECYYPQELFKGASKEVRDLILNQLELEENKTDINHILMALAWIGDDKVVEIFNNWKKQEPNFSKVLYVPAHEYSYEAGWKLDSNGNKRDLFFKECYGVKVGQHKKEDSVSFIEKHNGKCKWCGRNLNSLLKVDLNDEKMKFLEIEGKTLNLVTCDNCACYGNVYMDVDFYGRSRWSSYNITPEYLPKDIDLEDYDYDKSICIEDEIKNKNYGISQFVEGYKSKIGGLPTWIQDAEYPKCPKCGEDMIFIGQVSMEDVMEYGEGIYYGFLCKECKITGTAYQQT
ncbi:hypothetical protein NNC19_03420 [Clostridium sp. SHJSY1]|uniref:hypothetical protein n=1 Tax=Clostridium sp. SHJSY1 TaxID=2942483 RepID=UPI0028751E90|nr:hypothetical protein [Clostridium sp. SHJSY1]MDS0524715.1 hypothetical protein [Clostridium sp. SHJSY1]